MPRPPSFYFAEEKAVSELHALIQDSNVPPHYKSVVQTIIELQLLNGGQPIERKVLMNQLKQLSTTSKLGISASMMSLREKEMTNLGVMEEEDFEVDGKRAIKRKLMKLSPLMSDAAAKKFKSSKPPSPPVTQRQIQLALSELSESFGVLQPSGNESSRIDALFTGVLDAMVRLSQKDTRNLISGIYRFGQEKVAIETSTLTGKGEKIMILSDYRVIRALNEMFVRNVEDRFGEIKRMSADDKDAIHGDFIFDVYDLCVELGLKRSYECAVQVRKILRRLSSTEFKIDASDAPAFREKFLLGAHEMNIRYLTESRAYKEYEEVGEGGVVDFVERLYLVRFHSSVLYGLLNDSTRHIAHPELVRDRSGIAHRFNNWCKIVIGVRPGKKDVSRTYLLDELWEEMMSSSRLDNFTAHFQNLLARECIEGKEGWSPDKKNRSLIYGYYVEFNPDIEVIKEQMRIKGRRKRQGGKFYPAITIWRDAADSIVGDNSDHNLALRRSEAELKGQALSYGT